MNRKSLYLNVLAGALLLGAGSAQAARLPALENAIRVQAQDASMAIRNEQRAGLQYLPLIIHVPGVSVGEIRLVETHADTRPATVLETTAAGELREALRRDLAAKALEVPGMFGVYRYMAASALTVAIVVAE